MLSALELRGIRDVERGMQFLTNGRHFPEIGFPVEFRRLQSEVCKKPGQGWNLQGWTLREIIAGIQDWYLEVRLSSKA